MCGATFDVRLPTKVMEATVSYKVKFDAGYAWGLGGKLPGVCSDGKLLHGQIQHSATVHGLLIHMSWCLCIQSLSLLYV